MGLGGIGRSFQVCPSPHFKEGAHSIGCAYREGFANFHAAIAEPALTAYRDTISANGFYPSLVFTSPAESLEDGSASEGAVASFFWDLLDGTGESHDAVSVPGSYIADLISGCQVRAPEASARRANGIDDLTYCMEGTIDSEVVFHEYYFRTRQKVSLFDEGNRPPVEITSAPARPAGLSAQDVRTLWVETLHALEPTDTGGDTGPTGPEGPCEDPDAFEAEECE